MEQNDSQDILARSVAAEIKRRDSELAIEQRKHLDWLRWLEVGEDESDEALQPLKDKRKNLAEMWQKFDSMVSSGENATLKGKGQSQIPTVADLYNAVVTAQVARDAQKKTMSKRSKNQFLEFCGIMNDHSFLFQFIPAGDKYVSLISGVVISIVKASVNHNKIEEAFSLALVELSWDLGMIRKKTTNFDSRSIRRLVVELYTEVFGFLCLAMSWYTSWRKRLKAAINKNFYDRVFKTQVDSMQRIIRRILAEAEDITQTSVIRIKEDVAALLALQDAGNASRLDSEEQIRDKFNKLGERMLHTLVGLDEDEALKDCSHRLGPTSMDLRNSLRPPDRTGLNQSGGKGPGHDIEAVDEVDSAQAAEIDEPITETQDEADIEIEENTICTRVQVKQLVFGLEKLAEDGRVYRANTLRGETKGHLPDEVMLEFRNWITAIGSKMIWVAGASSSFHGSDLSLAAMRICDIGIDEGIASISFFAKPHYDFAKTIKPVLSQREAATVALLYSIIIQLSRLLPPEFAPTADLDADNFHLLDRSLGSIGVALRIIKALIANAPPVLMCVIDGFDLAESRTTRPHLSTLMAMLREQQDKKVFKICITTEGNSRALATSTRIRERVDASRMAQEASQGMLRGASDMNELRRQGSSRHGEAGC